MRVHAILLAASWLFAPVFAGTVTHDGGFTPDHVLRVTVAKVPSACEVREDVVVNGTSPGPAIRIPPGARTWIRVYNDMADRNLSMHWHGIAQRLAPFADGTPGVSQWPIPPGHFFDYEILTEVDDSGSYFYHSHVDMQAMSCTGPLIVDDCGATPYDYDDERILLFQDHFRKSDDDMVHGLTSAAKFAWSGETNGLLLNGKGVATGHVAAWCPAAEANGYFGSRRFTWASVSEDNNKDDGDESGHREMGDDSQIKPSSDCTLPVIDVEPGKTYRFRFIGSTSLSVMTMGFEDHSDLTIVQVDGSEYNAPVPVNHIQLAGGQRFDVLFRAKTAEELHASGNREFYFLQFETRDRPEVYRGYAVLRYNPNADVPPAPPQPVVSLPTEMAGWMEYTFQPLDPDQSRAPSSDEVTRRVIMTAQQKLDPKTGRVVFELSRMAWVDAEHQKPVLVDIYERGHAAIPDYIAAILNGGWDPETRLFPALMGEVLEIVIQNTGSLFEEARGVVESHPFHAHGQHYYDVGSGPGLYDAEANNAKLAEMDYRPVKRDTTLLFRFPPGKVEPGAPAGWRAWRVRMENAGVWMMHCHILAHMIMGMQSIWVVGDADDIMSMPVDVSQDYLVYGGSVYGNATHDPDMVHFFDDEEDQCPAAVVVEEDC